MQETYVIMGAYGGIGSALTRRLAARGARLMLVGRDEARLNALAGELGAESAIADATASATIEAAIAKAVEIFGAIDGVANCLGSLLLKPAHVTTDEELESVIAVNLKSAFATVRGAVKAMKTPGSIVLISSVAARYGLVNHEAIAAAKAGIEGLAVSAAATYAKRGIRINCVAPGLTATPLTARITTNETAAKASLNMIPLNRFGSPEELGRAIEFLLLPENSWITGQVLAVDGGMGTVWPRGGN